MQQSYAAMTFKTCFQEVSAQIFSSPRQVTDSYFQQSMTASRPSPILHSLVILEKTFIVSENGIILK
jgi:hypothetical protein